MPVSEETQKNMGLRALKVLPKEEFGNPGKQAVTAAGVPKWKINVQAENLDDETFSVSISSPTAPVVKRYEPILFVDLVVGAAGKNLWFAAKGMKAAGLQPQAKDEA